MESAIYSDVDFTLRSLRDLVDTLAGLPGRKAIFEALRIVRSGHDIRLRRAAEVDSPCRGSLQF